MKIKKETLINFIKKVSMSGVSALTECILDFSKNGIKVSSTSASNNVLINAILNAKCVENYDAIGQVAVHNIQDIAKLLDGFSKEFLTLSIEKNKLIIMSSNRKVQITLMDKDVLQKPPEYPKDLEDRTEIKIDIDIIKNFLKNVSMVGSSEFSFKIKGNEFYFHTESFNSVSEKIKIQENIKESIKLKLNRAFTDAIENISGEVNILIKSDYPITITEKIKDYTITILVAPVIQEEK